MGGGVSIFLGGTQCSVNTLSYPEYTGCLQTNTIHWNTPKWSTGEERSAAEQKKISPSTEQSDEERLVAV